MDHKFTEAQAEQIINNVSERVSAGETEIDKVISDETQRVINEATAKTLTQLNSKFSKELEEHLANVKKTKSDYNKYFKSDRYSDIEKERQKNLMQVAINADITSFEFSLNYEVDKFMKNFEIDRKAISSMEYQIRLANTLKLLELDPNLGAEYFDFIVEAKDYGLLKLLSNKFKSETLMLLVTSLDKNKIEEVARGKVKTLISYVRQGEGFVPKSALFQTLK